MTVDWARICCARLVVATLLLCHLRAYGQSGPQPPCGITEPVPAYPGLGDRATVKAWSKIGLARDCKPPVCTGWTAEGFTTLVTTVARFRDARETQDLLRHIGSVSGFTGMRYWSTTHQQWQTLIAEAHALVGAFSSQRREDFAPGEMKEGAVLYFEQVDNLSGKGIYRLPIAENTADRLVFDVENVSTMRYLMVPILRLGEMQSIYFLDRESADVWRYYSMMRTGRNANRLIGGNESSTMNCAAAYYCHIVGIPTDQEPPAAR